MASGLRDARNARALRPSLDHGGLLAAGRIGWPATIENIIKTEVRRYDGGTTPEAAAPAAILKGAQFVTASVQTNHPQLPRLEDARKVYVPPVR